MSTQSYYIGTDLKFNVNITASGFNQDTDPYTITVYCGNRKIVFTQDDVVVDGANHYILVNTDLLKTGTMKFVVTAEVNDDDFDHRREVDVQTVGVIKSVI